MTTPTDPVALVKALLENPVDDDYVATLVAPNATYQSLSYGESDPWLTKVLPYAGLHPNAGPKQFAETFRTVRKIWSTEAFDLGAVFSDGKNVAVFGSFVYKSRTLGKEIKSPMAIHVVVEDVEYKGSKKPMITFMLFMEDTLGTTGVFRKEADYGKYVVDPDTKAEVDV